MDLLHQYQVNVPKGIAASTPEQALQASKKFNGPVVVKAQVLAGGRGKGVFDNGFTGGVHIVSSSKETKDIVSQMIGHRLITKQTGSAGRPCNIVYICEKMNPKREFYFAILLDRKTRSPMLVGSSQGGMDIEAVAAKDPSAIHTLAIDVDTGLLPHDASEFAKRIGFTKYAPQAADMMLKLYKLFIEKDALLVEINPFCELVNDPFVACLDAKINFDDNADFRQEAIHKLRDITQEDEREIKAAEHKLNYIGLDGTIGCLVNGAGLAMATMDLIKLHGGEPANFLDVGGGATSQQVSEAFKILTSDPRVTAILVNIFGGIMRCDIIAEGIIEAVNKLGLNIPLVVRLQGTRVQEAKELILKSKLKIFACDDLTNAAIQAVCLSNIVTNSRTGNIKVNFEL